LQTVVYNETLALKLKNGSAREQPFIITVMVVVVAAVEVAAACI
jgi:hypothetical protein